MAKPKLLLDENIGYLTAARLRSVGWDVVSVLEDSRGISDAAVLKKARTEKRIIVTMDRDFGALVFRDSRRHVGVLLLRLQKESADNIFFVLKAVFEQHGESLAGSFVVASESQVRIRKK